MKERKRSKQARSRSAGSGIGPKALGKYLDRYGCAERSLDSTADGFAIETKLRADGGGETVLINIIVTAGGRLLRIGAREVAKAPIHTTPEPRLRQLLAFVSVENYVLTGLAWGFDPRDGEVALRLDQTVEGELSYRLFEALLSSVVLHARATASHLRSILGETTDYPAAGLVA